MRLLLNGDEREIAERFQHRRSGVRLGLDARKVAVERNLEIAPRSTYADTALADGDRIEIVTFHWRRLVCEV
jgi:sulfur carrier protein